MEKLKIVSLLHAVNYWTNYQRLCQRSFLFSEKYLSVPIGEFLNGYYGQETELEHYFRYDKGKKVRGFLIDYVVLESNKIRIAIEVKWVESGYNCDRYIRDFIRLSIIGNLNPRAQCFFLLAGRKNEVQNLLAEFNALNLGLSNKAPALTQRVKREWNFEKAVKKNDLVIEKSVKGIIATYLPKTIYIEPIIPKIENESENEIKVLAWKVG